MKEKWKICLYTACEMQARAWLGAAAGCLTSGTAGPAYHWGRGQLGGRESPGPGNLRGQHCERGNMETSCLAKYQDCAGKGSSAVGQVTTPGTNWAGGSGWIHQAAPLLPPFLFPAWLVREDRRCLSTGQRASCTSFSRKLPCFKGNECCSGEFYCCLFQQGGLSSLLPCSRRSRI